MTTTRSASIRLVGLTFATLAVMALSGCGGGGGGGGGPSAGATPAPTSAAAVPTVPQTVYASIDSFIGYLNNWPTNETKQPLSTGKGSPPQSDTALPTQINN